MHERSQTPEKPTYLSFALSLLGGRGPLHAAATAAFATASRVDPSPWTPPPVCSSVGVLFPPSAILSQSLENYHSQDARRRRPRAPRGLEQENFPGPTAMQRAGELGPEKNYISQEATEPAMFFPCSSRPAALHAVGAIATVASCGERVTVSTLGDLRGTEVAHPLPAGRAGVLGSALRPGEGHRVLLACKAAQHETPHPQA